MTMPNNIQTFEDKAMTCPGCLMPFRLCKCPKGGGDGNGSDQEDNHDTSKTLEPSDTQSARSMAPVNRHQHQQKNWSAVLNYANKAASIDSVHLLQIEYDPQHHRLTFQGKPGLLPEQIEALRELLNNIQSAFHDFKNTLKAEGISVENLATNTVSITLSQQYFRSFMQYLVQKEILPASMITPEQTRFARSNQTEPFFKRPTPFPIDDDSQPARTASLPTPLPTVLKPSSLD